MAIANGIPADMCCADMSVFNLEISYANGHWQRVCAKGAGANLNMPHVHRQVLEKRLQQMKDAPTLAALMGTRQTDDIPDDKGNFHELTGDRKGQIACSLPCGDRLIFTPDHNPLPKDAEGQLDWSKVTSVEILEIKDYHKRKPNREQ